MTRFRLTGGTAGADLIDEAVLGVVFGAEAAARHIASGADVGRADARSVTCRYQHADGTVIVKRTRHTRSACAEGPLLRALHAAGLPVPGVVADTVTGGWHGLVMVDLGQPDPGTVPLPLPEAAALIAWMHRAGSAVVDTGTLPVVGSAQLAELPHLALHHLDELAERGQRLYGQLRQRLFALASLAQRRAACADRQPVGLCHGQLHPSRMLRTTDGWTIVGWSRAALAPVLLDLATLHIEWTGPGGMRPDWTGLLAAYAAGGGDELGDGPCNGLPAQRWATGWQQLRTAAAALADATLGDTALPLAATTTVINRLDDALEHLA
ncbi:phosphotransferase family protein [Dactylosporangium sp. CA-092794]|uniref:phosphotransferase family protein n=1 Tax=Dactylosporangium sp. CA-092794 TaxID=3239929 RepID=UPI003D8C6B18